MIKPEPPFRVYRVTWEIQIDATSPEVAAERAREIQMDPRSTATVFSVRLDEGEPSDPVTVDLGYDTGTVGDWPYVRVQLDCGITDAFASDANSDDEIVTYGVSP